MTVRDVVGEEMGWRPALFYGLAERASGARAYHPHLHAMAAREAAEEAYKWGQRTTPLALAAGPGRARHVVEWFKPEGRPEWTAAEQHEALPATLAVRELRYEVGRPGLGTRTETVVTTPLDAEAYPLVAVAEPYGARWPVELNPSHLKTTMRMDVLNGKTFEGVLKELTASAIVYSLVRVVPCPAAPAQAAPSPDETPISAPYCLQNHG